MRSVSAELAWASRYPARLCRPSRYTGEKTTRRRGREPPLARLARRLTKGTELPTSSEPSHRDSLTAVPVGEPFRVAASTVVLTGSPVIPCLSDPPPG